MTTRAVLFDLGNTLVGYYTSTEFPSVLRRCLGECVATLDLPKDARRDEALFDKAMSLNRESDDFRVRPLEARLQELFSPHGVSDHKTLDELCAAFLTPIFGMARLDEEAVAVLQALRALGVKTAIVSNTPWGSPAANWRAELGRHGLLEQVDAAVFCVDVGWRKPHPAPFERALTLLDVSPSDTIIVGDDPRWDIVGAQNAGVRPVLLGSGASDTPQVKAIAQLLEVLSLVEAM